MGAAAMSPASVRMRLDVRAVMAEASQQAGLQRFGDPSFVEVLTRWYEALARETFITAQGAEIIRGVTIKHLVNRLRFVHDLETHPEILEEDVSDPVVITGLPRTGTTKLQRVLSRVEGFRGLQFWELLNPAPFPGDQRGTPDPRIAEAEAQHRIACQLFPEFQAGHPSEVDEPEEEMFMMEMSFEVMTHWRADLPVFQGWLRSRPSEPRYRELHRLLQYLQWQAGGRKGRSLVLKTPVHLDQIEVIQRVFPHATLVHCHRDPRVSVASNARLHELLWQMAMEDVDPRRVGDEVVDYWSRALNANLSQRDALANRTPIVDVFYETIAKDPLSAIGSILETRKRRPSKADQAVVAKWEGEHPAERWGGHRYSQKTYGLSDARIESAFAPYLQRFFPHAAQV